MKQKKKKKKGLIAGVGSIVLMILVTLLKPDILGAFIQTVGNYLIHKDELKITDEKECKVEIDESYSEYIKTHEHLREDIIYIEDMYSKWLSNNRVLPSEDEDKLKHISSRLFFIKDSDEGNRLKQKMKRWLIVLVPSIKSDMEEYEKIKEQMDQETTTDVIKTPDTSELPELIEAMEEYDKYFKTFIKNEEQNCVNRKKENK